MTILEELSDTRPGVGLGDLGGLLRVEPDFGHVSSPSFRLLVTEIRTLSLANTTDCSGEPLLLGKIDHSAGVVEV